MKEPPLAGWNNGFYLRDPGDYFRIYPRGRVHLDFHTFPGAPTGTATEGAVDLQPRFFARRLRFELSGEAFKRFTFTFGVDFGGQTISNANGTTGTLVPSDNTTGASARYSPVEAVSSNAIIANAFINYSFCPCLNIMVGQHQAPFGIENRTSNNAHSFMERHLPIRSFVAPNAKELGLTLWGDLFDARLSYELGVYAGDGQNRPQIDGNPDFIGRVFTRPLLGNNTAIDDLQLGVSARTGQRDPKLVGYDYQPITTAQGWTLWEPRYKDSLGRTTHILPSGTQLQVGGELRLPVWIFELRGEGYYVSNDTREAIDGYQLKNTERLGAMTGAGWYVQLSAWPLGDAFVNGAPGIWRPMTLDLSREPEKPKRGLEVVALIGGVNATYDGASRGGVADPNTPTAGTSSKIDVFQYGLALNYWYTRYLRASVNYVVYHTPGSGTPDNLASVPANERGPNPGPEEHLLHELGTRLGIGF
ncbi:MAG: porin [Polyangiaceae bacterium]